MQTPKDKSFQTCTGPVRYWPWHTEAHTFAKSRAQIPRMPQSHKQTTNTGMLTTPACAYNTGAKESTRNRARFRCAQGRKYIYGSKGTTTQPHKQNGVRAIEHKQQYLRRVDGEPHTCAASSLVGASTRARGLATRR